MNIQRATTKDINELFELVQRQFLEHEIGLDTDQLEIAIRHILTHEGLGFFLIATDKAALLFVTFCRDGRSSCIFTILSFFIYAFIIMASGI